MDIVSQAVQVLNHGGTIVYPTDTVYGLGADALNEDAILQVYEMKRREISKPISVAVSDEEMLRAVAVVSPEAEAFIRQFLPGPLTVVLKAKRCLPEILTGGTGMIGVRIPRHDLALAIISAFDTPITATSANLSGEKDPATINDVHICADLVIDGGRLSGKPSTVVDLVTGEIVRAGVGVEEVTAYLAAHR
ncbi:MAG: threonylcarbamoyl-AMP synthase [Methanomicrobiales archaeon]|nr:threonylcarbamoyl-AMP synthase [Methanomicrobiales archaeon]